MVRRCTHCKKEDTLNVKFKYCGDCIPKVLAWLNDREEPNLVDFSKRTPGGRKLLDEAVKNYYHKGRGKQK